MEQATKGYSSNSEKSLSVTKLSMESSAVSTGPSSYQAAFGYKSRRSSSLRFARYAGRGSIAATSVGESFAEMPEILSTKTNEKHQLSSLNDRFATYIDKVRRLESQNRTLSARVVELESSRTVVSRAGDIYEDELARLRREIEKLTHDKADAEIQLHNCSQLLAAAEKRIQDEIEGRREADGTIKSLRKDVDDATLARIDLERKLETLQEEIELLKATTNEDIETLKSQVVVRHEEVFDAPPGPVNNITDSLRDIRVAYEQLSSSNSTEIEKIYKTNITELQQQLKVANQSLSESRSNLMDTRRQMQSLTVEIDGLRSTNSSLESQIAELESRMDKESNEYRKRIAELEEELQKSRDVLANHLADYNKLLNLKMSLDLEISTYRKLLEGEEGRISQSGMEMTINDKSINASVSSITSAGSPRILVKEEVTTKSRSSSSSSSSSSDSD